MFKNFFQERKKEKFAKEKYTKFITMAMDDAKCIIEGDVEQFLPPKEDYTYFDDYLSECKISKGDKDIILILPTTSMLMTGIMNNIQGMNFMANKFVDEFNEWCDTQRPLDEKQDCMYSHEFYLMFNTLSRLMYFMIDRDFETQISHKARNKICNTMWGEIKDLFIKKFTFPIDGKAHKNILRVREIYSQ